jgi:hypothetical protein
MGRKAASRGSVLLMTVFVTALLAALVMGMLEMNSQEIQLMQNHVNGVEALAVAEAGLNDALAEVRLDSGWTDGFADKPFDSGSYTVSVDGATITSTGVTAKGFVARVEADITVSSSGPPYVIRVNRLGINE